MFLIFLGSYTNVYTNYRYNQTECSLAVLNFALNFLSNQKASDLETSAETIKDIEIARSITRTLLDYLKMHNHNDFLNGFAWLIYDANNTLNMINNQASYDAESSFKLNGAYELIESSTHIYASLITSGTWVSTSSAHKARLLCAISSLARLIGSKDPSRILFAINIIALYFYIQDLN